MHAGLHQFRAETISWFRDAVSEEGRTRSSLARDLCALEGWTGDRGEPCPGSARKALPVLVRKLGLELPAAQAASGRGRRAGKRKADYPDLSLRCRLAELDVVIPEPVSGDTDRRHWESMMATHHPQGRAPGGQLRYRVCSSVHGRLGGIGFCAASWHRKARDDYIGWSADARAANLSKAINNHRFLLLPGVRCRLEKTVLAIQDATSLNYHGLRATGGPVGIGGGGSEGVRGLWAHTGLAISPAGRPLGVFSLDATCCDSDREESASVRWQHGLDRAQELARACPSTRVVTVRDREADIRALFVRAASQGAGLLVRARRSARRRVVVETGGRQDLWDHAATLPRLTGKTVKIAACGGKRARPERTARLDLRAGRVKLAPPSSSAGSREPLDVLVVTATEPDPPPDREPLHWLLLTTEGNADAETARTVVA